MQMGGRSYALQLTANLAMLGCWAALGLWALSQDLQPPWLGRRKICNTPVQSYFIVRPMFQPFPSRDDGRVEFVCLLEPAVRLDGKAAH
jgi:hypothetical protein